MGGLSLITSDQNDETIWKILAMENWLPDIGFKTLHNSFQRKAEYFYDEIFANEATLREGVGQHLYGFETDCI